VTSPDCFYHQNRDKKLHQIHGVADGSNVLEHAEAGLVSTTHGVDSEGLCQARTRQLSSFRQLPAPLQRNGHQHHKCNRLDLP
jgi:hypothetical protein